MATIGYHIRFCLKIAANIQKYDLGNKRYILEQVKGEIDYTI